MIENGGKMTMGQCIKWYRRMAGYNRRELAEKIGMNAMSICNWENDNCTPDLYSAFDTAQALGITVEQLIGAKQPEMIVDDRYLRRNEIAEELSVSYSAIKNITSLNRDKIRVISEGYNTKFFNIGDVQNYILRHAIKV